MRIIRKAKGRRASACVASLPNDRVCGAPLTGAADICHACRARIHHTMINTLYRYGQPGLARELDAHYQYAHSPETHGLSCYQCFGHRERHARAKQFDTYTIFD